MSNFQRRQVASKLPIAGLKLTCNLVWLAQQDKVYVHTDV